MTWGAVHRTAPHVFGHGIPCPYRRDWSGCSNLPRGGLDSRLRGNDTNAVNDNIHSKQESKGKLRAK